MRSKRSLLLEHTLIAVVVSALGHAGCSPGSAEPRLPTLRPLGRDIPAFRATGKPTERAARPVTVKEPTGTVTLRQALALALTGSPALAAASWEVRAAEARALQAGLPPNPELRVRREDFAGTGQFEGTDAAEQFLRLSQVIEIGWKASKRRKVARGETALCGWDYESTRLDVFTETTKAFVAVLAARSRLAAAREMHELAEHVMSLVSKRVKGGAGSGMEAKEARIGLGTSRIDLERARRATEGTRGLLAACWGAERPKFQQAAGELEDPAATGVPALEQLLERITSSPGVARWETEAHMRQAALELEKANCIPDLRVLVAMRRIEETRDHGYSVALEVALPIFDRNQGAVHEARLNRIKVAHERRAAIAEATVGLRQAHQILSASYQEAALLKDVVLPAARDALDMARLGLQQGAVTDLQVLKAQRELFRAKTRRIDALEAYHTAVADIERLTAHPISAVKTPKRSGTRQRQTQETQPEKS